MLVFCRAQLLDTPDIAFTALAATKLLYTVRPARMLRPLARPASKLIQFCSNQRIELAE